MNNQGDPIATADEFHEEVGPRHGSPTLADRIAYGLVTLAAGAVLGLMLFVYLGVGA